MSCVLSGSRSKVYSCGFVARKDNRIDTSTTVEDIIASIPLKAVVIVSTNELVIARTTIELIVAVVTLKIIITILTKKDIITVVTLQGVVAIRAVKLVNAGAT